MGSPELAKMADFYADLTGRFALTDSLALWRDSSERLHQLATEPEDVTYREVTANGGPPRWVIPAGSSPEHVLLHSHSGGSVVASMYMERKAVGHVAKAVGSRALLINYRLSPEDKFPAQIDDVEAAYRWLLGRGYDPSRIASIGGSIGGGDAGDPAPTPPRAESPPAGARECPCARVRAEGGGAAAQERVGSGLNDPAPGPVSWRPGGALIVAAVIAALGALTLLGRAGAAISSPKAASVDLARERGREAPAPSQGAIDGAGKGAQRTR